MGENLSWGENKQRMRDQEFQYVLITGAPYTDKDVNQPSATTDDILISHYLQPQNFVVAVE
jgi:hypothetical protein